MFSRETCQQKINNLQNSNKHMNNMHYLTNKMLYNAKIVLILYIFKNVSLSAQHMIGWCLTAYSLKNQTLSCAIFYL